MSRHASDQRQKNSFFFVFDGATIRKWSQMFIGHAMKLPQFISVPMLRTMTVRLECDHCLRKHHGPARDPHFRHETCTLTRGTGMRARRRRATNRCWRCLLSRFPGQRPWDRDGTHQISDKKTGFFSFSTAQRLENGPRCSSGMR